MHVRAIAIAFAALASAGALAAACGGNIEQNRAATDDDDASASKRAKDSSAPKLASSADAATTADATAPTAGCDVDGVPHEASGQSFPCPDGCNTCWCRGNGIIESTLAACTGCWPPRPLAPGVVCTGDVVYAKSPSDGTCCPYASACYAPTWLGSWKIFPNETECESASP